ncbi:unnamed protein product [Lymnaea stagnalis]|uniref:Uncharacterized protein n=1 Tax=Lymnaea stagnalis TaxID=6523 RepID=A0AAV2ISZ6_LYMST
MYNESSSFPSLSSFVIFSDLTELASTQISLNMSTDEMPTMSSDMVSEISLVPSVPSSNGLSTESQLTTPVWMSSVHVSSLEMNGSMDFSVTSSSSALDVTPTIITVS